MSIKLETSNLILRDHLPEDWVDIHEYASIPEFSQYDFWGPNTEQDSKDFVTRMIDQANSNPRFKYDLAVYHKESNKVIGGIGVRRATESSYIADLGYAITPNFQGKGYASEAVNAIFEFGFNTLNLKVIYATWTLKTLHLIELWKNVG